MIDKNFRPWLLEVN